MSDIHPHVMLPRQEKENLLGQGQQGRFAIRLDGDNLRTGLNANLGFSDDDRLENIRRTAELAKILAQNGVIVLCSLITPRGIHRDLARGIIGNDFAEIHVKASCAACEARDVKGLYAKAAKGQVAHFTGRDSSFEEPQQADLVLDTERLSVEDAVSEVLEFLREKREAA